MEIVWLYTPVLVNLSLLYNTKSTVEKSLVIFEIGLYLHQVLLGTAISAIILLYVPFLDMEVEISICNVNWPNSSIKCAIGISFTTVGIYNYEIRFCLC